MKNRLLATLFFSSLAFSSLNGQSLSSAELIHDIFLNQRVQLGLESADIQDYVITDQYISRIGGVEHIYFKQTVNGIIIDNATANLNLLPGARISSFHSEFVLRAASKANSAIPDVLPEAAIRTLAAEKGITLPAVIEKISEAGDGIEEYTFSGRDYSMMDVPVKLRYFNQEGEDLLLAWNVFIYTLDQKQAWEAWVDAHSGSIITARNHVISCQFMPQGHKAESCANHNHAHLPPSLSRWAAKAAANDYNVFAEPLESPNHGTRSIENSPWDLTASPFGWHDLDGVTGPDTNITMGNNVHAYSDWDNTGNATSPSDNPSGGATNDFNFPINFALHPDSNRDAAVTNLFYWNNFLHDVLFNHGFDEASGNMQEQNYSGEGLGGDGVHAEAMDGGGTNNANMLTLPDGLLTRMQMYLWTTATPNIDGDFDNGIIAHEYGHSLSIRLTGGPNNTSCLGGNEQMGEGWSDWLGLITTIDTSVHIDSTGRGIGTYALDQPTTGGGIRTYRYSVDSLIAQYNYDDIKTFSIPHGVGSVWASMTWDLTWAFINEYGYDDIMTGAGGNNMVMNLMILAMKLQSCNPGFVDGRDAILEADEILFGGANKCLIWKVFARRGLGFSAYQGVPRLRGDGDEAYDLPFECENELQIFKTVDDELVLAGGLLNYSITVVNQSGTIRTQVLVTDTLPAGTVGSLSGCGTITSGVMTYLIDTLFPGESHTCTFTLTTPSTPFSNELFADNMEAGTTNWTLAAGTGTNTWAIDSLNPHRGSKCWYGIGTGSTTVQNLEMANTVLVGASTKLRFKHQYNFEHEWDGGIVEVSTDSGSTWSNVNTLFEKNGYDTTLRASGPLGAVRAFTGASLKYITSIVDLSSFAGDRIIIRFRIATDAGAGSYGWYIDDVFISDEVVVGNVAHAESAEGDVISDSVDCPTLVRDPALPVELLDFNVESREDHLELIWTTASEINNRGFWISRRNASTGFSDLAFVEAAQTGTGASYAFKDYKVEPGITYYYQLRQEDFDGTTSFSNIEKGKLDLPGYRWTLFPNPSSSKVYLQALGNKTEVEISVYNALGQKVKTVQALERVEIEVRNWSPGLYHIEINNGQEIQQIKLVKQN